MAATDTPNTPHTIPVLVPLTPADVRALDGNAEALGVPTRDLMDAAGHAVAREVGTRWPEGTILVCAGLGNNGGDGLVAARVLHEAGRRVKVLLAGDADTFRTDLAADAWNAADAVGVPLVEFSDVNLEDLLEEADVVIDALLGVGVTGALRSPIDRIVTAIDDKEVPVVAVDLPTGHGGPDSVYAVVTVTFHDRKVGMDPEFCGDIVVADIGIPREAERYVGPGDVAARYPRTPPTAHKGDMGRLLIVAGGPYTGAPVLCAMGAFSVGTDLVHMALPGRAAEVAMHQLVEAIIHPLEGPRLVSDHAHLIDPVLERSDVLLIGPGLGRHDETVAAVRQIVEAAIAADKRLVLDADALNAFEGDSETLARAPVVVTPHAGEFRTLTGIDVSEASADERIEAARSWIGDGDAVVLMKGPEDLIVSRDRVVRNRTHHPSMTTGGTGDVLAGVTAALIGRGADRFDAARMGAYLNGSAGLLAFDEYGYAVRAGDVANALPLVLRELVH